MGMGTLNVWVSAMDDPCGYSDRTWYVTIYDCDGNVFEYCGRRYVVMPARCGHLEVDLPPGCYYVKANWSFSIVTPNLVYRVNHFTDGGIATVCCGETSCLKLFNPSVHRCGFIYVKALQDLVAQKAVDPGRVEVVAEAVKAIDAELREKEGPPPKLFELGNYDEIYELTRERAEKEEG